MTALAQEVESTLQNLDPLTATKFERLVRDAVALVKPAPPLDKAYFESVIGVFADVEFQRPPQGELPASKTW